jgi:hypothetical protein
MALEDDGLSIRMAKNLASLLPPATLAIPIREYFDQNFLRSGSHYRWTKMGSKGKAALQPKIFFNFNALPGTN